MGSGEAMKIVIAVCLLAFGISQARQEPSEVRIRFLDSQTGFAIPAETIQLNRPTRLQAGLPAGVVSVKLDNQPRIVTVTSNGYRPLSFTILPTDTILQVRLSPTTLPEEFSSEAISRLREPHMIIVIGFVSDATKGTALSGVRVSASQSNATAETNGRGFFVLHIPAPTGYSSNTAFRTDIQFYKSGYRSLIRQGARVAVETTTKYRVRLEPGSGTQTLREQHRGDNAGQQDSDSGGPTISKRAASGAPTLPSSIRVGRDCSTSTSCTTVEVSALEDYTKHVLPNEWIASWLAESLKAGSVAVRSVGVWYTVHPKASSFDVCDTTACQVYDPDNSSSSTDAATDATAKNVLVQSGTDTVAKAEYAAENNHHSPCDDGQTGDGASWPCADDSVCRGQTLDGHGRGMCQRGSQRWAQGSKDMDWILTHYYPNFDKVTGN